MADEIKEISNEQSQTTLDQAEPATVAPSSEEATAPAADAGQTPASDEAQVAVEMLDSADGQSCEPAPEETATPATDAEQTIASEEAQIPTDTLESTDERTSAPSTEEAAVAPAQEPEPTPDQSQEPSPTIDSVIEAILFATDEPLPESRLAGIVETTGKQVRECVEGLNARYEANHNAFRIEQIAGGYQMLTQPLYNSWLKKMLRVRSDNKLSPAAMETLAIIAYKQPIIRADIEAIRGVAVGEVIRSLMYKGLVKIAGRAEILGRPMLYGTTKKFLEIFGLNSIKDLPKAEDLKNPDRG